MKGKNNAPFQVVEKGQKSLNCDKLQDTNKTAENDSSSRKLDKLSKDIDQELRGHNHAFPFEIFPKYLQQLIDNSEETVGYNREFLSVGILSVCATAIGNSAKLNNGSYLSKPIFWISIIGRRGTKKTHPLVFVKKPIEKRDARSFKKYIAEYEEYVSGGKKGIKPNNIKTILKDFTPEKLADTLQHNENGILIFQDELMRWVNSFDQYNKGGDQQMYLDIFNGGSLTVDRMSREPIRIEKTNVNILGGMQPEMIKGFAKNNRSNDGFSDRFLFSYPELNKPHKFTGRSIENKHIENYEKLIYNLLDMKPLILETISSNLTIFKEWQHAKVIECSNDNIEEAIQAKLETYVWRFALVLELINQASSGNYNVGIQDESIRSAIKLIEYFRFNALKIHDKILSKNPLDQVTARQKDIFRELPPEFKRSDVLILFKKRGFSIRSADRFLRNTTLFDNYQTSKVLKAGNYKKKF